MRPQVDPRSVRGPGRIVAGLCLTGALLAPGTARASSDAGIELQVGSFQVQVYYSDSVDYPDRADEAIRDPRLALFALASLLQANVSSFGSIRHTFKAALERRKGSESTFLVVVEDPEGKSEVLLDTPLRRNASEEIARALCKRYRGACKRPPVARLRLYPCRRSTCPGRIRFGAFPSDSVNARFGLLRAGADGGEDVVRVARAELAQYFERLE